MEFTFCPKCRYNIYGAYKYCPECGKILHLDDEKEAAVEKKLDEAEKLWTIGSYEEASKLYYRYAREGNARAQKMVGDEYSSGLDGHYAFKEAFYKYQQAAEKGYTPAIFTLGYCYELGEGVSRDWQQAVEWYQKAANFGHIHAMYCIGKLYERGDKSLKKDMTQAFQWYQKAAEMGDGYAIYEMGQLYESGIVVEKDWTKAVFWYEKSIKTYGSIGKKRLEELMSKGCKEAELALKNLNKKIN